MTRVDTDTLRDWSDEKRSAFADWLRSQGVDPDITYAVDFHGDQLLSVWIYKRDDEGRLYIEDNDIAREEEPVTVTINDQWEYEDE